MEQTFVLRNTDILKRLLTVLSALPIGDGDLFEIVIRKHREIRTIAQNNTWHRMVRELAPQMGHTPAEMKDIVKYALGYWHKIPCTPTKENPAGYIMHFDETSQMSIDELSVLIDQTYEWAASKGVILG